MININLVREDIEKVKKGVEAKGYKTSVVDEASELDGKWRELLQKIEVLRAQRNKAAKEQNIEEGKRVKKELQGLEDKLPELEKNAKEALNKIPNLPDESAPHGKGEKDNVEIRKWGKFPKFDFPAKSHLELGEALGILDFESGAKVAGSGFYYLKGDGVLLELALLQFGLDFLIKKGYEAFMTPDLAKSRYYLGTGYLPKGDEAQIYEIDGEDLGLVATAEVTMAGLHADQVLQLNELPLKYAAISHCFRKEAGSYGKYSKGLYRVHQFTKLEMFVYTTVDNSDEMHKELLKNEEDLMQALEIPYRVLEMCTGDLGAIASKKYDLEAWMPGRDDYGEVTSTSNTTDYQARNLNIKYNQKGSNEYAHLLNGTALAISRMIVSILENNQQKDGSVKIPKVLQKYMGKEKISLPTK